jgi:hypothetical protein
VPKWKKQRLPLPQTECAPKSAVTEKVEKQNLGLDKPSIIEGTVNGNGYWLDRRNPRQERARFRCAPL